MQQEQEEHQEDDEQQALPPRQRRRLNNAATRSEAAQEFQAQLDRIFCLRVPWTTTTSAARTAKKLSGKNKNNANACNKGFVLLQDWPNIWSHIIVHLRPFECRNVFQTCRSMQLLFQQSTVLQTHLLQSCIDQFSIGKELGDAMFANEQVKQSWTNFLIFLDQTMPGGATRDMSIHRALVLEQTVCETAGVIPSFLPDGFTPDKESPVGLPTVRALSSPQCDYPFLHGDFEWSYPQNEKDETYNRLLKHADYAWVVQLASGHGGFLDYVLVDLETGNYYQTSGYCNHEEGLHEQDEYPSMTTLLCQHFYPEVDIGEQRQRSETCVCMLAWIIQRRFPPFDDSCVMQQVAQELLPAAQKLAEFPLEDEDDIDNFSKDTVALLEQAIVTPLELAKAHDYLVMPSKRDPTYESSKR